MATFSIRGVHLNIKKVYADGRVGYRHYHKRGKGAVCIGETAHKLKGDLPAEMLERALAATKADGAPPPPRAPSKTLRELFDEWQASAEYRAEVRSRNTRQLHDDNIEKWCEGAYTSERGVQKKFGDMPYVLVEQDWAKDKFLTFRDRHSTGWRPCKVAEAEANKARRGDDYPLKSTLGVYFIRIDGPKPYGFQFRETPKAADHLTSTLGSCLAWAKRRGKIKINPMEGVERLYRSDRAMIIWEAEHLKQLQAGAAVEPARPCPRQVWDGVLGAALTGLAMIDLLRLRWPMILEEVIDLEGGRTKTGTEAMPPILPETRMLFERIRREQKEAETYDAEGFVFLNSRGKPWTPSGFGGSFQEAKTSAGIGKERHFHDLRGTAATMFVASPRNYSDLQIDLFMGWKEGEGGRVRRKYVNARNVAKGLQALLEGETCQAVAAIAG
ncbi:MAG: tyrosine-type recombinase/integrase [Hyphomonadaceae bacterium]